VGKGEIYPLYPKGQGFSHRRGCAGPFLAPPKESHTPSHADNCPAQWQVRRNAQYFKYRKAGYPLHRMFPVHKNLFYKNIIGRKMEVGEGNLCIAEDEKFLVFPS